MRGGKGGGGRAGRVDDGPMKMKFLEHFSNVIACEWRIER